MNDVFTRAIAQADLRGSFLLESDLDRLASFASNGNRRLDAVAALTNNAAAIISDAAHKLFAEQPALTQPGGNSYPNRRMAACLRDMEIILRYITYSMLAGDPSVLDDRCLNGLRETYNALGTPTQSVARAVSLMKESALNYMKDSTNITQWDCGFLYAEAATYFDKASSSIA
jgi:phycocyanin beta chain